VDTYLAGTVSAEALSAIGLATTVIWLVNLLFSFVATGSTALVARYAGMGDRAKANHFANQSVALAGGLGLMVTALIWSTAPLLPHFFGWSAEPARLATMYLRIDCWGYMIYSLTFVGAACWRGVGDTRTPLYIMMGVNAWNVVVAAALRFGWGPLPELGVVGIPLGTVSARVLGGTIVVLLLLRAAAASGSSANNCITVESVARLLRFGIPAGLGRLDPVVRPGAVREDHQHARHGRAAGSDHRRPLRGDSGGGPFVSAGVRLATAAATMVGQSLGAAFRAGDAERAFGGRPGAAMCWA